MEKEKEIEAFKKLCIGQRAAAVSFLSSLQKIDPLYSLVSSPRSGIFEAYHYEKNTKIFYFNAKAEDTVKYRSTAEKPEIISVRHPKLNTIETLNYFRKLV